MFQDDELLLPTSICGRIAGALVSAICGLVSSLATLALFWAARGGQGFGARLIASAVLEIAVAAVVFSVYGILWSITQQQWVAEHLFRLKRKMIWIAPLGLPVLFALLALV